MDEPASGLDIIARERLFKLLEHIADCSSVTMIYVTHYTEEILPLFKHCLMLKDGQILTQGLTEHIFTSENLSLLFNCQLSVAKTADRYNTTLQ